MLEDLDDSETEFCGEAVKNKVGVAFADSAAGRIRDVSS